MTNPPNLFQRYLTACHLLAARLTRVQGYAVWVVPLVSFWLLFEVLRSGWAFLLLIVVFIVAAPYMTVHHRYWQDQKKD